MTLCDSIAWLMTSSPTRLIRRSTRSRSTRIVWRGACGMPRHCSAAAALRRHHASFFRRRATRRRPSATTLAAVSAAATAACSVVDGASDPRPAHRQRRTGSSSSDRTGRTEPAASAVLRPGSLRSAVLERSIVKVAIPFGEFEDLADRILALVGRERDLPGEIGAFRIDLDRARQCCPCRSGCSSRRGAKGRAGAASHRCPWRRVRPRLEGHLVGRKLRPLRPRRRNRRRRTATGWKPLSSLGFGAACTGSRPEPALRLRRGAFSAAQAAPSPLASASSSLIRPCAPAPGRRCRRRAQHWSGRPERRPTSA